MIRTAAFTLLTALLLAFTSPVRAEAGSPTDSRALGQTNAAQFHGWNAANSGSVESAKYGSATAFDGSFGNNTLVAGKDSFNRPALTTTKVASQGGPMTVPAPQLPSSVEGQKKIPTWAAYAGSGALGALQGGLSAGLLGAAGGAVIALAITNRYMKGDYGGAIGISAGAIIGTAIGGPLGGLIGGVIGGVVGHFIGRLFSKK